MLVVVKGVQRAASRGVQMELQGADGKVAKMGSSKVAKLVLSMVSERVGKLA